MVTKKLEEYLESGEFYSCFRKAIFSIEEDNLLLKWLGKYVSEIQAFELYKSHIDNEYRLTLQLYSDYGLGPRVYVSGDKELVSFLTGGSLGEGSRLVGRGMEKFFSMIKSLLEES